jgi:hypothetical protein
VPEVEQGSEARGKAEAAWSAGVLDRAPVQGWPLGPCTEVAFPAVKGYRWSAPPQPLDLAEETEADDDEIVVTVPWHGEQPVLDLELVDSADTLQKGFEQADEGKAPVIASWAYLKLQDEAPRAQLRGRLLAIYQEDETVKVDGRELQRLKALAFFVHIKGDPPRGQKDGRFLCQPGDEPIKAMTAGADGFCHWLLSPTSKEDSFCLDLQAFGAPKKVPGVDADEGVYSQLGPIEGGCFGCDLTQNDCVGRTEAGVEDFGLQCVDKPEADSGCEAGQFRQCAEACDQWQICSDDTWGSCEKVADQFPTEGEDPNKAPTAGHLLVDYGPGALTCLTPQVAPERKAPEPAKEPPTKEKAGDSSKIDIELKYDEKEQPVVTDGVVTFSGEVCNNHETQKVEKVVVELHHITEYLTDKEALEKLEEPLVSKPVTLEPGGCEKWSLELSGLPADDYQYTLNATYEGIDDPVPGNNRLDSGTGDYTVDEPEEGEGGKDQPAGETAKTLEVKLKAVKDDDTLKVQYIVQVCSDGPAPAKGIKAGLYLDRDERPGCGDEADEDWVVVETSRLKNCWTRDDLEIEAKAKKFKVWAVADVACELLEEGDRGRSTSTTVDLRPADEREGDRERDSGEQEKSPGDKERESTTDDGGCRLGNPRSAPLWPALLALLALGRRRPRD